MKELTLNTVDGDGFFSFYTGFQTKDSSVITGAPGKAGIVLRSLEGRVEVEGIVLVGRPEELPTEFPAYFEDSASGSRLKSEIHPKDFKRRVRTVYESIFVNYVKRNSWSSSGLLGTRSISGEEVAQQFLRYGDDQSIRIDNPARDYFSGLGCTPVPFRGRLDQLTYDNQRIDVVLYDNTSHIAKIGMFSEEDAKKLKTLVGHQKRK